MRLLLILIITLVFPWLFPCLAEAASGLSLDSLLSNPTAFLSQDVVNVTVKTLGIVFDHRPLEPATPLGVHPGFDFGFEVDLVQIPDSFAATLSAAGLSLTPPPVLPNLRLINIHKGIFESVDVGASYFSLLGYVIWAVDLKVVIVNPEEGATWAIRLSRTSVSFPIGNASFQGFGLSVDYKSVTWTPQLVVSKKLDFADPYIGIGYQYVSGGLEVTPTGLEALGISSIPGISSVSGSGGSFMSFIGLSLKTPGVGLGLTIEGTYSLSGYNALGTKIGFSF